MIVDGRQIAAEILARTKTRAERLVHPPRVLALVASETPATLSYMKVKARAAEQAGCVFETRELGSDFHDADAIIVQLPLPAGRQGSQQKILDAIPVEKDADVLSSVARKKFENSDADALLPPVVAAVREIFLREKVEVKGKKAVVVGRGFLVGVPVTTWLAQQGAEVEVVVKESGNFSAALRAADLIVSGAGSPHLIKPNMLKVGVVLLDAGTSESSGEIVGDADPACASKCALFTPVPGGVGPVTVAKLFENAVELAARSQQGNVLK